MARCRRPACTRRSQLAQTWSVVGDKHLILPYRQNGQLKAIEATRTPRADHVQQMHLVDCEQVAGINGAVREGDVEVQFACGKTFRCIKFETGRPASCSGFCSEEGRGGAARPLRGIPPPRCAAALTVEADAINDVRYNSRLLKQLLRDGTLAVHRGAAQS